MSTFPNTNVFPGQGSTPLARVRISTSDVSVSSPVWTEVAHLDFRSLSISRGRESEMSQFDAGTATVVLDDRDRAYDPVINTGIRPMNRVWVYEEFSGEVKDLFRGYVDSWEHAYPDGGFSDATVTLNCTDEFKVLSLDILPTTSPVRSSYDELVASDAPDGYWRMNNPVDTNVQPPAEVETNPFIDGGSAAPTRQRRSHWSEDDIH